MKAEIFLSWKTACLQLDHNSSTYTNTWPIKLQHAKTNFKLLSAFFDRWTIFKTWTVWWSLDHNNNGTAGDVFNYLIKTFWRINLDDTSVNLLEKSSGRLIWTVHLENFKSHKDLEKMGLYRKSPQNWNLNWIFRLLQLKTELWQTSWIPKIRQIGPNLE